MMLSREGVFFYNVAWEVRRREEKKAMKREIKEIKRTDSTIKK